MEEGESEPEPDSSSGHFWGALQNALCGLSQAEIHMIHHSVAIL